MELASDDEFKNGEQIGGRRLLIAEIGTARVGGGRFGSARAASATIPFSVPDSYSFTLIAGVF